MIQMFVVFLTQRVLFVLELCSYWPYQDHVDCLKFYLWGGSAGVGGKGYFELDFFVDYSYSFYFQWHRIDRTFHHDNKGALE